MVQGLLILLAATGSSIQEQPVAKASVTSFVEKAMPFLRRAERGMLEESPYRRIEATVLESWRITDLHDAFKVSVQGATFDWHNANELVQWARLWTLGDMGEEEPPFDESLTIDQTKIEPLVNHYVRAAGYREAALKVTSVRLIKDTPSRFLVGATPVHLSVPYSRASSVSFEIDYRHGRLIQMRLYGHPRPPENLTPQVSLASARTELLQRLFAKYDVPGVEEADFKLAIAGLAPKVENDDAVKHTQRVWNVQGQLVYEARFKHINTFGENRTPVRMYMAMIDANTNEVISLNEAAPGGVIPGKRNEPVFSLSGPVTVIAGKQKKEVRSGRLEVGSGSVSDQAKAVLIVGKERSFKAKFDKKSGLVGIADKVFRPNLDLRKALASL